jgi:hypothetical protein
MSESTYTARLVGSTGTETIELDLIDGLPRKSIIRGGAGEREDEDVVWELVTDSDDYEYREAGRPAADYS